MLRVGQGWPLLRVCWDCGVYRVCCVILDNITDLPWLWKKNSMRKRSLGQGTSAKLHHFECLFQSLSHQTKPVWLDKHPSQEGYTLHIAKSNCWSQIKLKKKNLNPEKQHQNVNASNQSDLELPLQPGHIVNAHPYRPHCPSTATWILLLLTHQVTWHWQCKEDMPGKGVRESPSCSRMK